MTLYSLRKQINKKMLRFSVDHLKYLAELSPGLLFKKRHTLYSSGIFTKLRIKFRNKRRNIETTSTAIRRNRSMKSPNSSRSHEAMFYVPSLSNAKKKRSLLQFTHVPLTVNIYLRLQNGLLFPYVIVFQRSSQLQLLPVFYSNHSRT